MSYTFPRREQTIHFLPVQCVSHICCFPFFAFIDAEVEFPGLPDGLEIQMIGFLLEELIQTTLLLLMHMFEFASIVILSFDCHVHLYQTVVTSSSVLVIVSLVFTHIAASHTSVLCDKSVLELFEQFIICHFVSLN